MWDESEFNLFYRETWPALWAYVHKSTSNPTLADDLVQETYVRMMVAKPKQITVERRRSYLFRIASNLITDHWRRSNFERVAIEARRLELTEPQCEDTHPDLHTALNRLPLQQRSLLWLAYVEKFNHREIAEALKLKEKSIKVLLFRARQKLVEVLQAAGPQES